MGIEFLLGVLALCSPPEEGPSPRARCTEPAFRRPPLSHTCCASPGPLLTQPQGGGCFCPEAEKVSWDVMAYEQASSRIQVPNSFWFSVI